MLILLISNLWNQNCIDNIEIELWGDCYNISTTVELDLFNSDLYGNIPSEIGGLINLIELNLGRNNLTGAIPESIGNLINLERLYLHENNLNGTLPEITNQNLPLLDRLYIQDNELTFTLKPKKDYNNV